VAKGGGGLVRRICSLADGKRSTADIHKELKNAEGTRNEPAALMSKTLFKQVCLFVCLFASFCKPVNLLPIAGTSGRSVHFPLNLGKTMHCFLRQSTTTYQLVGLLRHTTIVVYIFGSHKY
jgi:heme/copper-type cytochrome/quinol oxidase subunit 3